MKIVHGSDLEQISHQAADSILQLITRQLESAERFSFVLTGGGSPRLLYPMLAEAAAPWERVDWFWGDERCVPPDHEESNYKMARELLLDPLGVAPERVHRMRGEMRPIEAAADSYADEMAATLSGAELDLVLLGMGDDGHICSLFPGSDSLKIDDRDVIAISDSPKPPAERITLTLRPINAARAVHFLISGEKKRRIAEAIRDDRHAARQKWPAALVEPASGTLVWFVGD